MKESTNSRLGHHWFAQRQMARPLQLRNRTFPSPKFACLVLPHILFFQLSVKTFP